MDGILEDVCDVVRERGMAKKWERYEEEEVEDLPLVVEEGVGWAVEGVADRDDSDDLEADLGGSSSSSGTPRHVLSASQNARRVSSVDSNA